MANIVYCFSRAGERFLMSVLADWRVEGAENVPRSGPLIVVANHLSNMDPPLLACSIPRRLHYLSKRGVFIPIVRTFLRAYGAYPVDREGRDLDGFHWCRKLLESGGALAMFPEATRSPAGGMKRVIPGAALLALRTQAAILPVGITGTEHIGPILQNLAPTGRLRANIGKPFTLPPVDGPLKREQLEALATQIMLRVAELLPARYRGVYQLPEAACSARR